MAQRTASFSSPAAVGSVHGQGLDAVDPSEESRGGGIPARIVSLERWRRAVYIIPSKFNPGGSGAALHNDIAYDIAVSLCVGAGMCGYPHGTQVLEGHVAQ